MSTDLQTYPEYKESGFPWLGSIPQHWDCLPHRAIFEEIKEQGYVNEPLLSVTIGRGIVRQDELLANSSKKDSSNMDKSKYKLVEPGDIAYNKMRAWQGAVGLSRYRGIVSPAYIVQRLRSELRPEYFHYLFRTPGFGKEAERWSYGITSDQWSLRPQHFKMIYSCVPPLDEQELIVGFLLDFDRQVRRFICNRRRLIEVLNEQKQAIISRAVTRGLDPNAPSNLLALIGWGVYRSIGRYGPYDALPSNAVMVHLDRGSNQVTMSKTARASCASRILDGLSSRTRTWRISRTSMQHRYRAIQWRQATC